MRRWCIQCKNLDTNDISLMAGGIYNDLDMAKRDCQHLNTIIGSRSYKYSVIELVDVEENKKYECDMTEAELKEYQQEILDIDKDLHNIIDYDEWAGREYGETSVDYYSTAIALYNAGYRKVREFKND